MHDGIRVIYLHASVMVTGGVSIIGCNSISPETVFFEQIFDRFVSNELGKNNRIVCSFQLKLGFQNRMYMK